MILGGSSEYPPSTFLSRNKKNNVYPCETQFYYIKMGLKGSKLYRYVFVMFTWFRQLQPLTSEWTLECDVSGACSSGFGRVVNQRSSAGLGAGYFLETGEMSHFVIARIFKSWNCQTQYFKLRRKPGMKIF